MKTINLTPHDVRLNDGREFPPSGQVARVTAGYEPIGPDMFRATFGEVVGLPSPELGTIYVVSGMVASAVPERADVVSPATGHPAAVRRDGQVYSVPGWIVTPAGRAS